MAAASSSTSSAGGSPAAHAPAGGVGGGGVPNHRTRFGDTTLTKVFVGGLAWETPSEGLHEHFEKYGEILEAVVITDRETGKSKGYGFVTFREAEAAREAVREPNPTIGGRRANCNIASMGPPRPPPPSRERAPRGSRFPHQPHMGPQPYMSGRMPTQQMTAQPHPMYYPPQFGCQGAQRAHVSPFSSCWVLHDGPLNLGRREGDSSSAMANN
uniref:RRM domain-containing protein n=1 Tax=Leersia perrieri TaxID=77586 RepID=A0A0D9VL81_9ORYZ